MYGPCRLATASCTPCAVLTVRLVVAVRTDGSEVAGVKLNTPCSGCDMADTRLKAFVLLLLRVMVDCLPS